MHTFMWACASVSGSRQAPAVIGRGLLRCRGTELARFAPPQHVEEQFHREPPQGTLGKNGKGGRREERSERVNEQRGNEVMSQ